ncbi:MAG: hypothetical protein KKB03_04360 [Nanoarchaeota archaeon]|nr:hypothetical protein [Nanoarchaeota archaeon]MBU2520446.1 hypothetical protein [Nanoarchaeota archaeon]
MKFATKAELEKLESFLETEGNNILFHHNDADGICSAALFLKFFQNFDPRVRGGPILDDDFVKEIEIEKPDLLVFLDLPVDQSWKKLDKIMKKLPELKIVIIDHHIFEKNMNSENVLHINPMLKSDEYIPASAVVYDILKEMKKPVKPYCWISCIGIIGDYGFETSFCKDVLKECKKMYPDLLREHPLKSKLAEGVEIISSSTAVRGFFGAEFSLDALLKSRYFNDFSSVKIFETWRMKRNQEFERVVKRADSKKEIAGEVIFYPVKSKLSIYQDLGTHLGEINPNNVIITIRDLGDNLYKIGMRGQSGKHNLGELAKKCSKGIGNGGGHPKAAGAVVNDIKKFKKRFLKEVNG